MIMGMKAKKKKKHALAIFRFLEWIAKLTLSAPTGSLVNTHQRKRVYINNKVVPKSILRIFGFYLLMFGHLIIFVSWNVALVDVKFSCDTDNRDCFVTTENETAIPVTNCSDYSSTEDVSIQCFQLIGDPAIALGVASGMLTFIKIFMKGLAYFLIWYYSKEGKSVCGHRVSRWFLFICHLIGLFIFMSLLTVPFVLGLPLLQLSYTSGLKIIVLFLAVLSLSLVSILVPWCYFTYNEEPDDTEEERERREQLESREEQLEGMQ